MEGRYRIEIEARRDGRLVIRVRPPKGPEVKLQSLEALYRYLAERLGPGGAPLD